MLWATSGDRATLAWMITETKHRKLLPILENYLDNQEQTMLATLTSRRDHNFRVQTGKINQSNKLITLYERTKDPPYSGLWDTVPYPVYE